MLLLPVVMFLEGLKPLECESLGNHEYRIAFTSSVPVKITLDGGGEIGSGMTSPATVKVPDSITHPIFRLSANGETRSISERHLALQGTPNFRDLGGYETVDGRHVAWGKLYRSGSLAKLTAADYEILSGLGLSLLCDFRTSDERASEPTVWQGKSPRLTSFPIGDKKNGSLGMSAFADLLRRRVNAAEMKTQLTGFYAEAPIQSAPQYKEALAAILDSQGPAMFHCAAGKDRTGVFGAIMLTILGVKHDQVVDDYALTNRYFVNEKLLPQMAAGLKASMKLDFDIDPETLRPALRAEPDYIKASFAAIEAKYGSFDRYRREALGVSDADQEKLRRRFLES